MPKSDRVLPVQSRVNIINFVMAIQHFDKNFDPNRITNISTAINCMVNLIAAVAMKNGIRPLQTTEEALEWLDNRGISTRFLRYDNRRIIRNIAEESALEIFNEEIPKASDLLSMLEEQP